MRTTYNAADTLSVLFLMTLIPQCLGRPASALFGRGHKALPLSERRDSAIADRKESIIDRRESVISRRESVNDAENVNAEAGMDVLAKDNPVLMDNKNQHVWFNRDQTNADFEQSEAVEQIIRGLGYDVENVQARQLSSSEYPGFSSSVLPASTSLTSSVSTANPAQTETSVLATSYVFSASTPTSTSTASASSTVSASSTASVSSTSSASSTASASLTSSASSTASSSSTITSSASTTSMSSSKTTSSIASTVYPSGAASRTAIIVPVISSTTVVGTASHAPMMTYVKGQKNAPLPTLAATEVNISYIDNTMQSNYPMWDGSGSLIVNSENEAELTALSTKPIYSRDQGKGGNVAGVNMFIFADTGSYTAAGSFTGFVSNSIAVDRGLGPASNKPVTLSDPIGSYSNNVGAPRGFIPLTEGEQAYNNLMIPHGQRFAIWPESAIIPLNPTTGLMYAPIVYINGSDFTFSGVTAVEITVPSIGGPVANRVAPLIFPMGGVEWGCIGGVRSYGPNGISGGRVYILGNHKTGLFVGRTNATTITDASSYQFFQGNGVWNSTVPTTSSTNVFVQGGYSYVDIFYSPRHLTFLMIFMDEYADNTIFYRYLQAPEPILPTYAGGSWSDIAEALVMYSWSKIFVLMNLPAPGAQYTYGGGYHPGYFGANDITRGGNKMLLSWTAPTGQAAGSLATGYAPMHGVVTFD